MYIWNGIYLNWNRIGFRLELYELDLDRMWTGIELGLDSVGCGLDLMHTFSYNLGKGNKFGENIF